MKWTSLWHLLASLSVPSPPFLWAHLFWRSVFLRWYLPSHLRKFLYIYFVGDCFPRETAHWRGKVQDRSRLSVLALLVAFCKNGAWTETAELQLARYSLAQVLGRTVFLGWEYLSDVSNSTFYSFNLFDKKIRALYKGLAHKKSYSPLLYVLKK